MSEPSRPAASNLPCEEPHNNRVDYYPSHTPIVTPSPCHLQPANTVHHDSRIQTIMSIRRSFMGSLRRAASSSPAMMHLDLRDSPLSGSLSSTPKLLLPPTPKLVLNPIHEDQRPPTLDREVDLFVDRGTPIDVALIFQQSVTDLGSLAETNTLFTLPPKVRMKIYGYCFSNEHRKICLSPRFATKAVFPEGYFASPWDVLESVWGGLSTSRALRHDLMAYFWTQYHFHVTLTMLSGPKFSPLSHVWLMNYLHIIQHLTLEADLTRFGGSTQSNAPEFGYDGYSKVERLMTAVVSGLSKQWSMAELNLMCRRYAGMRPSSQIPLGSELPYCPEEVTYLCNSVSGLRGIVQRSRMAGFTLPYTKKILSSLFAEDDDDELIYIIPVECAWPPLPTQTQTRPIFSPLPLEPSPKAPVSQFEVVLSRSPSFAKSFEEEMAKYGSSPSSSHYVTSPVVFKDGGLSPSGSLARTPRRYPSMEGSLRSRYADHDLARTRSISDATSMKRPSPRALLTPSPKQNSRCPTPTSPNTMNKQNEQDPAFQRTIVALRSPDLDTNTPVKPRPFSDPSPQREPIPFASLRRDSSDIAAAPEESTKKKHGSAGYASIFSRFRGRRITG